MTLYRVTIFTDIEASGPGEAEEEMIRQIGLHGISNMDMEITRNF